MQKRVVDGNGFWHTDSMPMALIIKILFYI
jgi:hypothetical protein